jgi:hypothetical protein
MTSSISISIYFQLIPYKQTKCSTFHLYLSLASFVTSPCKQFFYKQIDFLLSCPRTVLLYFIGTKKPFTFLPIISSNMYSNLYKISFAKSLLTYFQNSVFIGVQYSENQVQQKVQRSFPSSSTITNHRELSEGLTIGQ